MGGDIFVTTVVGILKGLSYIYDVVLYIPWYIYDRPDLRLKTSRRIRVRSSTLSVGSICTKKFDDMLLTVM